MRSLVFVCLLFAGLAWSQGKPAGPAHEDSASSKVAPDAAVITVKGLCNGTDPDHATAGAACTTVVTRAEFEKLVDAVQSEMDKQTRQHLATAYPQFLEMAQEAEKRKLDKSARFEERMRFARLQILSQELVRQIQEDSAHVPDSDIDSYYKAHAADYQQVTIERIVFPLRAENSQGEQGQEAMKKEADAIRARAAAGEDFVKLQRDAYVFAGTSGNTEPNPSMGKMRRRSLPPTHASVFDLQPGEVSPVISDSTGFYIYKMDSKGMLSLEDATPEIRNTLRRQRLKEMMQSVQQPFATEVNHTYFGTEVKDDD